MNQRSGNYLDSGYCMYVCTVGTDQQDCKNCLLKHVLFNSSILHDATENPLMLPIHILLINITNEYAKIRVTQR